MLLEGGHRASELGGWKTISFLNFSPFLWTEIASAIPECSLKSLFWPVKWPFPQKQADFGQKRHQFCLAEIDIWLGHLKSLLIPSQTPACPKSGHSAPSPPRVGTFLLHRNLFPQLTLNQQLPQSDLMCSPSASSTEVISCSVQLHLLPMPAGTSLPPPPSSNIPNLVQSP